MKIKWILAATVIVFLGLVGCRNHNEKSSPNPGSVVANTEKNAKQLNITILLDLSDRIAQNANEPKPTYAERDIEIVNYFTELFKKDMQAKGAFAAKGKIKVVFTPRPKDNEINKIASELNIDLSSMKPKEKKKVFDNISAKFKSNLKKIYDQYINKKVYYGADIWRFFKNDVADYCIENDSYRNILVLITDGYIYHADSRDIQKNRTTYILPSLFRKNGLRSSNWKQKMKKGDYGFITTRDDLKKLDVLVLEIVPEVGRIKDEDLIKSYLERWFTEMNVNRFAMYNSDLPEYTKKKIKKFLAK